MWLLWLDWEDKETMKFWKEENLQNPFEWDATLSGLWKVYESDEMGLKAKKKHSLDDHMEFHDRVFAWLSEHDRRAQKTGTIVGRYLRFPVADGAAYYQVQGIIKGTNPPVVSVEWIPCMPDNWSDQTVEEMDRELPMKMVMRRLKAQEGLARMFGG